MDTENPFAKYKTPQEENTFAKYATTSTPSVVPTPGIPAPSISPSLKQSGTQRDVMGITSPQGREQTENIKHKLDSPTAEAKNPLDFMQRVVPESAAKTIKAGFQAPYTMGKRIIDPVMEAAGGYMSGNKPGIQATKEGLQGVGKGAMQNVGDIAKFLGKKGGIVAPDESGLHPTINPFTMTERMKHEALTDPIGSMLAFEGVKGAVKSIPKITEAAKTVGEGVGKVAKAVTPKPDIDKLITERYEKAVRPTVSGKKTSTQIQAAADKVNRGVKKIIGLKDQGAIHLGPDAEARNPESLKEFGTAISQGKESVFNQYDTLQKEAGEAGAVVTPEPAIKELSDIVSDPDVKLANPKAVAHAAEWIKRLNERGTLSTESAQKVIKSMNTSLDAYYDNPTYDTAVPAYIDSLVANHLRKGLDKSIEEAKGPGYQDLKNDYGALKSMEKEVNHRAVVDARKNIKGLLDFSDIFSGAEIAKGILRMDPSSFITGVAARGIKKWYETLNNPNHQVKRMFDQVDKHWDRGIQKPDVTSGIGTAIPEPEYGEAVPPKPGVEPAPVSPQAAEAAAPLSSPAEPVAEPPLPDYKGILDDLTKQTGIVRGKGKKNWTDSDFRNWLKQSYPTVAARYAKGDIFKALEGQSRGEKLGKHQQRIIDAFNEDHQTMTANETYKMSQKADRYAAEAGMDTTGWTDEDRSNFVEQYEAFKRGQK